MAVSTNANCNSLTVQKYIIKNGVGESSFPNGTKVRFHIKTEALEDYNEDGLPDTTLFSSLRCKVIDDSRVWGNPVELLIGKQFKLEVLESSLNTMKQGEISSFLIHHCLLTAYPTVSKTLRKAYDASHVDKEQKTEHHCCGMGFTGGLGHKDLDELMTTPRHMKITIELLQVELPGSYEKQYWEMSEEERVNSIPVLQEEGNALYKKGLHVEAIEKYREAIGRLENLMLKEKPNDTEWLTLNKQKLKLLLNYSQCLLLQEEYYEVVEHCSTVLQYQPDNVKALFRRGKARVLLCDGEAARADLAQCSNLDPSTASQCRKLCAQLASAERKLHERDRKVYGKLFGANSACD